MCCAVGGGPDGSDRRHVDPDLSGDSRISASEDPASADGGLKANMSGLDI